MIIINSHFVLVNTSHFTNANSKDVHNLEQEQVLEE
jgi:hypothetical protein